MPVEQAGRGMVVMMFDRYIRSLDRILLPLKYNFTVGSPSTIFAVSA